VWYMQASNKEVHLLDTLLTVFIIHQLVVFYWRGVWEIFDVQLLPDDSHASAVVCLIIAYSLQMLVCLLEALANFLRRSVRSKITRCAVDKVVFFFANIVNVALWRGVWLLLNCHLLPDNRGLSAGLTHLVGIVLLWIMLCAHSVTVAGCRLDGESPDEEAFLSPNYYLRMFFTQTKQNQGRDQCSIETAKQCSEDKDCWSSGDCRMRPEGPKVEADGRERGWVLEEGQQAPSPQAEAIL